jgi:hypothetical protein
MSYSFVYTLPKNAKLYHAHNRNKNPINENRPTWFTETVQLATDYVKVINTTISKFNTKRPLKLLDINNMSFHQDFISKINNKFNTAPNMIDDKMLVSMSLGYPNDIEVNNFVRETCKFKSKMEEFQIVRNLEYFNNKSRYSNTQLDKLFVDFLIEEYEIDGIDGYISRNYVPSKTMCAWFAPEICIFRPMSRLTYEIELSSEKPNPHHPSPPHFRSDLHKSNPSMAKILDKRINQINEKYRKQMFM